MNQILRQLWCAVRGYHQATEPHINSGPNSRYHSMSLTCDNCGQGWWRGCIFIEGFVVMVNEYKSRDWKF
jgi:hypothetical protein